MQIIRDHKRFQPYTKGMSCESGPVLLTGFTSLNCRESNCLLQEAVQPLKTDHFSNLVDKSRNRPFALIIISNWRVNFKTNKK